MTETHRQHSTVNGNAGARVALHGGFATATPRQFTRAIIEEIIWWHAVLHDDPDRMPVTYAEVMSDMTKTRIVRVRHDCIRRVRQLRPHLSLPELGRIFRRDHSTIMAALNPAKYRAKAREHHLRRVAAARHTQGAGHELRA